MTSGFESRPPTSKLCSSQSQRPPLILPKTKQEPSAGNLLPASDPCESATTVITMPSKQVLPAHIKPLNHEKPVKTLVSSFITTDAAFNRNHSEIVHLDESTHQITVSGEVKTPLRLSIDSLRNDFPQHEVLCALQCAGNRRHSMRMWLKELHGIDWHDGAVMNCLWKGPRIRDVLLRAGVPERRYGEEDLHVAFACHQALCQNDEFFETSVELWRVMDIDSEAILALEMNGEPLKPVHGYPVRVAIPGVAGARWVKWLDTITVQPKESPNFYQQHDYKVLPPEVVSWEMSEDYWPKYPAFQWNPLNSIIGVPESNSTAPVDASGCIEVKGIALPAGNDGPVTRVEVSIDDGATWTDARFSYPERSSKWAWVIWSASVSVPPEVRGKKLTIFSRAEDKGGNVQPRVSTWNIRGIGYNGYGDAVNVTVA